MICGTVKNMPKTKKSADKKKELLMNVLLFLAVIIFFLVIFEVVLRVGFAYNPDWVKPDKDYIYISNPGKTFTRFHHDLNTTITMHNNEKGYRGRIIPYSNIDNATRIFVVGDSLVECFAPGFENCFPNVMQDNLSNNYEVIAYGTASWALDNEYKVIEKEGLKYNPNIVIVAYFMNDFWDSSRELVFSLQKERLDNGSTIIKLVDNTPIVNYNKRVLVYYLSEKSYIARFMMDKLHKKFSLAKIGCILGISGFKKGSEKEELFWGIPKEVFYEEYDEDIEINYLKTRLILKKYKKLAEENNIKLYFAVIPLKEQVNENKLKELIKMKNIPDDGSFDIDLPYERFIKILEEENIKYIYPIEEFKKYEETLSSYYNIDGHFNKYGQKRFAKIIMNELN